MMSSPSLHHRRFLLLAGLGALPALLVLALGIHAVRRERALGWMAARDDAAALAGRCAARLRSALMDLTLPSRADLEAHAASPGPPEADPGLRIAHAHAHATAWFVSDGFAHPPPVIPAASSGGPRLEALQLPGPLLRAWHQAARIPPDAPASRRVTAWQAALEAAAGTSAEGVLRLHTARALLESGYPEPASALFRSVADAPAEWPGETGIPTRFLALRGWIHAAEVDATPAAAAVRVQLLDRLFHESLVRRRLSPSLLDEFLPEEARAIAAWRAVAAHQDETRRTIRRFTDLMSLDGATHEVPEWRWIPGEDPGLLTRHDLPEGRWWLFRRTTHLHQALTQVLAELELPAHLAAAVRVAGEEAVPPGAGQALLGQSGDSDAPTPLIRVALHLANPAGLDRALDLRTRRMVLVAGIAFALTAAASLAIVWAFRRQQRLAAMQSDFVASVTHELRAPLAAVRLIAEELSDLPEAESARRTGYHSLIVRETGRLSRLVENVLRHARLERDADPMERAPVDLRDVLRATRDSMAPAAVERDVRLRLHLPQEPVPATVDSGALQQVLGNLVDNALKHAPPDTEIEFALELRETPMVAAISVTDHGPGIPSADHARIFEPFFRRGSELRRETTGVGLGLAIARRLVTAHEGTLQVCSAPGRGARFTVVLPLSR
ncbi:MAG: hypothetical protein KF791_08995 [Verrucomicrobiae bacterium]|nr:hypothetical protein [Verrucomicrobiae bacterium]